MIRACRVEERPLLQEKRAADRVRTILLFLLSSVPSCVFWVLRFYILLLSSLVVAEDDQQLTITIFQLIRRDRQRVWPLLSEATTEHSGFYSAQLFVWLFRCLFELCLTDYVTCLSSSCSK